MSRSRSSWLFPAWYQTIREAQPVSQQVSRISMMRFRIVPPSFEFFRTLQGSLLLDASQRLSSDLEFLVGRDHQHLAWRLARLDFTEIILSTLVLLIVEDDAQVGEISTASLANHRAVLADATRENQRVHASQHGRVGADVL